MKDWKDKLPGYEPSEGSWFRLKSSLHLEEQLRRQLPEMPQHMPRELTWAAIENKLDAAENVKPITWYRWVAAAAVVLCCSLWGIWQLSVGTGSQQLVVQQTPAGQAADRYIVAAPATELPEQQEETAEAALAIITPPVKTPEAAAVVAKVKSAPIEASPPVVAMEKPAEEVTEMVITQRIPVQEHPAPPKILQKEHTNPQKRSRHKKIAIQWSTNEPKAVNIAFETPAMPSSREKVTALHEPDKQIRFQLNN